MPDDDPGRTHYYGDDCDPPQVSPEPAVDCAVALCRRAASTTAVTFEGATVACCDQHRRWVPMMAPPEVEHPAP